MEKYIMYSAKTFILNKAKSTKIFGITLGILLTMLITLASFFIVSPKVIKANTSETSDIVYVDELYNTEDSSINSTNLVILLRYLTGSEDVTPSTLDKLADYDLGVLAVNNKVLNSYRFSLFLQKLNLCTLFHFITIRTKIKELP